MLQADSEQRNVVAPALIAVAGGRASARNRATTRKGSTMIPRRLAALIGALLLVPELCQAQSPEPGTQPTLYYIPHTHWEGAVFKTRRLPEFAKFFQSRFESLTPHARGPERVGLAGVDVSEPEDYVPALIEQFNRLPDAPFTIRYAVPTDFAAVVAKRPSAQVITGDFNPIFPGTYSSRIESSSGPGSWSGVS